MANKTIPQLPEQTGKTDNDLLAIVDSGETTTSKIKVSTLLAGVGGNLLTSNGTESYRTPQYATTDTAGDGQLIIGGDGSSISNTDANCSIIGARNCNLTDGSDGMIIVGGWVNNLSSTGANSRSSISLGGYSNNITGRRNITGGVFNTNSGDKSIVLGGEQNSSTATDYGVLGGRSNTASNRSGIVFGRTNTSGEDAFCFGAFNFAGQSGNNANKPTMVLGGDTHSTSLNNNGGYTTFLGGYGNKVWAIGGSGHLNIYGGSNNWISASGTYASPSGTGFSGDTHTIINSKDSSTQNGVLNTIINSDGCITSGTTKATIIGLTNYTATTDNATYMESVILPNYASYNYADDTAAAAGGVVLGQVYHNNGALRVRIT